jgi:hypothetical protein
MGAYVVGLVSSMCWYASYSEGRIREDMEPSMTMKSLVPLLFTPVMVFTRAAAFATIERPGSIITVKPISLA